MNGAWCFVYGSNLCIGKMLKTIGGTVEEPVRAAANGFEVVFNKASTNWNAAATLVPHSRKKCHGVLYKLNADQFRKLCRSEGGYKVACIGVKTESGVMIVAKTFVARQDRIINHKRPKQEYLDFIWYGGLEQRLPRRYLRALVRKGNGKIPTE